jgi:LytS/YehU family sensor histidine kinase
MKDQLLMQKRTLMLEKEKAETELKLLKAQLNPHFLFNTLNNIYSLSYTSPARTSESIARLADILDHILYRANQVYVPLAAEVTLIRNYIELEKLRYDSRLTVNFTCAIEGQVVIAPLILLSLVENAFKHGASNDAGEPVIDIGLAVKGDKIQFDITNTVNDGDSGPAGTERIGLNNLQRQLDHIYGKDHELRVLREGNLFLVRLTIELKQERARYEKDKMFVGR